MYVCILQDDRAQQLRYQHQFAGISSDRGDITLQECTDAKIGGSVPFKNSGNVWS